MGNNNFILFAFKITFSYKIINIEPETNLQITIAKEESKKTAQVSIENLSSEKCSFQIERLLRQFSNFGLRTNRVRKKTNFRYNIDYEKEKEDSCLAVVSVLVFFVCEGLLGL